MSAAKECGAISGKIAPQEGRSTINWKVTTKY
jgi:hypothetical protein